MPQSGPLPQQPDGAEKALKKTLEGYQTRLKKIWETLMYGEANLLNIKKASVEVFINELSELRGEIFKLRNVLFINKYLKSVDSAVDKIGHARDELTIVVFLLGQKDTESRIKSRLGHYNECQKFLAETMKLFR